MTHSETLTVTESAELDIQEVVGGILASSTSPNEVDELFSTIVDAVEREDLQASARIEKKYERDLLLLPFLQDPRATVTSEVALLGALSIERTISRRRGLQHVTEFVTRSAAADGIDALYRTIEDGTTAFTTVETHLQGQLDPDSPCIISTADNQLVISERVWRRGGWQYDELSLEEGERGNKYFQAFVGSTLWAVHLAISRSAEERSAADTNAKQLLNERWKRERGPLA